MLFPILSHGLSLARSAYAGRPSILGGVVVKVITAQWMASLAMRLKILLFCGSGYHCRGIAEMKIPSIKNSNFWLDSSFNSANDDIGTNACFILPVFCNHPYAIELYPPIRGSVPVLLKSRNPFAILGCVVSVIVQALKRISIRSRPQVSLEVSEAKPAFRLNSPSLTDGNSAPSVSVEVRRCGAETPFQHVHIKVVKTPFFPVGFHERIVALSDRGV